MLMTTTYNLMEFPVPRSLSCVLCCVAFVLCLSLSLSYLALPCLVFVIVLSNPSSFLSNLSSVESVPDAPVRVPLYLRFVFAVRVMVRVRVRVSVLF